MKSAQLRDLSARLARIAIDVQEGANLHSDGDVIAYASVVLEFCAQSAALAEPQPAPVAPAPEPKRAAGKRAPKGQGSHRHTFNENGICGGCGASRQRRPRGSADAAPAAAPAAPASGVLPALGLPPNYRAPLRDADEFADGTMGSSGMRRP